MPTLITVLKSGGRYTPDWIAALDKAVRKHLPAFDRVLALSDMAFEIEGVERRPLRQRWPGWWSKLEAFRPGLVDGTALLCDLDTLFTGPAPALAEPGPMAMEDHLRKGRLSSALLRWEGDDMASVHARFAQDPARWMREGSCGPVPNKVHGDQVVIDRFLRDENRLPPFFQARHPELLDFYASERGVVGPVTIFIGETKPVLTREGLREPDRCAA